VINLFPTKGTYVSILQVILVAMNM